MIAAIGAASASMNSIRAVGQRRVDRQIRRPGLEHRQNRHDRLGGALQQQRHTLARARTVAGQQVRQPIRGLVELAIGHRAAAEAHRHRLRGARHLLGEQRRNRHRRRRGWVNTARLPDSSSRACSPASSRSIDDNRRAGSAVIAANTRSQPLDQRLDAGRVEHVGVEFDAKAQFAARAWPAASAGSGCIRGW